MTTATVNESDNRLAKALTRIPGCQHTHDETMVCHHHSPVGCPSDDGQQHGSQACLRVCLLWGSCCTLAAGAVYKKMHTYVLCVFTQHNVSTTDFQHVCHPQRGWVSDDIQDHCASFVVGPLAGGLSQSVPQWPFGCTHCEQWFIAPYPLGCLGAYTP